MDVYIDSFSEWLKGTPLAFVATHYPWVWPVCQILHFFGLVLLISMVGLLDLRILGFGKGLSLRSISRTIPLGVAGFALNLLTGAIFVAGDPLHYLRNPAFQFKIGFIAVAGLNVLVFHASGLSKTVESLAPDDDAPFGAKVVASLSMFLWVGVMYLGRMLPFLGNSF